MTGTNTAKTMVEVLAEHQDWTYQKNLGYYRSEFMCHCGETFWSGDHEEDPGFNQAVAAHQAAALSAAGFGLVADAKAEGARVAIAYLREGMGPWAEPRVLGFLEGAHSVAAHIVEAS